MRRISWYCTQALGLYLLIAAIGGSQIGLNIVRGTTWMMLFFSTCCMFVPDARESCRKKGHSVTQNEALIGDFIIVCAMFAGGWWFTAAAYILNTLFEQSLFFENKPKGELA